MFASYLYYINNKDVFYGLSRVVDILTLILAKFFLLGIY